MAIKFIAIDTDGTLLNSNGEILPSTRIAIKHALDKGIKVAFVLDVLLLVYSIL